LQSWNSAVAVDFVGVASPASMKIVTEHATAAKDLIPYLAIPQLTSEWDSDWLHPQSNCSELVEIQQASAESCCPGLTRPVEHCFEATLSAFK